MLTSTVIHLEAAADGQLENATGRGVHGLWFQHWGQAAPEMADQLHQENQLPPYTLSPLMDLPRPNQEGQVHIPKGHKTWFRATTLTRLLSEALLESWIPALDSIIDIPDGVRWKISGVSKMPEEHPWAGQVEYSQLTSQSLYNTHPPNRWRIRFATPTAFHASPGHFPLPLPDSLIASWLRRWQAFAPIALPDDLPEQVRQHVVISAYSLKTLPVREGKRLTVGCVGQMTLRALKMPPAYRAALDVLVNYAFFTGSGHRTSQGMGVTRRVG
jgi:CRISPR-associated endoribonuclease Cas6